MKVHLITGATGFVGKYLVEALLTQKEVVWVIVRPLNGQTALSRAKLLFKDYLKKWPHSFKVVDGDILEKELNLNGKDQEELCRNDTTVWHLAANLSFSEKKGVEVYENNTQGTANVVEFANKTAKYLIHVSTAYVCGNATALRENELDKGQSFRNKYEKSKFDAEKYLYSNCSVPYIVFRPSVIIGDAYQGKAEGCTFGYYRYLFIFYFFKKQVIKALTKKSWLSKLLKISGTSHNKTQDVLSIPWLAIPFPTNSFVDMVTVDYVIDSMLSIYKRGLWNRTIHITSDKPPAFKFLLKSVLEDLKYEDYKLVPVSKSVFRLIVKAFYFFGVPIRSYVKSVMWYIPYFTRACNFERTSAVNYLKDPPEISRELILKINSYAKENILKNIKVD